MTKQGKIYIGILILISIVLNYFLAAEGSIKSPLGQSLVLTMMFVPTISYFILRLLLKEKVGKIKIKFKDWKSIVKAYLLPFIYVSTVYFIVWSFGYYKDNFTTVLLITGLSGTLINSIGTIGEEIGWRGFLINEFLNKYSALKSSLIVGLIWSVWHIPGLIFTDYGNTSNLLFGIPFFVISLTLISVPMSYYVLKAKNIWPAILMHASHNALIQALFEPMTISNEKSQFLKDETGLILAIVSIVIGIIYGIKIKKLCLTTKPSCGRYDRT